MRTRKLSQGAAAVAMAAVLSMVILYQLPNGGSVTAASMAPIILYSFFYGPKWGLLTSFAYALIQMLMGFYPPPAPGLWQFLLAALLDYIFAFGALGLAGAVGKPFGRWGPVIGTFAVIAARFVCHFLSGVLIWPAYAPEGTPAWAYSLTYNGSYLLAELVLTLAVVALLLRTGAFQRIRDGR